MPGWSPEIANEFIRLSVGDRAHLNQLQLQELVYIAHGWRLALSGAPLTGDRPEASETGPMYRRLASALADYGLDPVLREITGGDSGNRRIRSDLDQSERDLIGESLPESGVVRVVAIVRPDPEGKQSVEAGFRGRCR